MDILILILTLLALLFSAATIIVILFQLFYNIINKDFHSLLKFLGNYKKGRFVLIYISVFLIQLANQLYIDRMFTFEGVSIFLKETIESIVLKIDYSHIQSFMLSHKLYEFTVIFTYSVVIINVILFIISLCLPTILRFIKSCKVLIKKQNIIIIGYNKKTITIMQSINLKKYSCVLLDSFTDDEKTDLIAHNYYFNNIKFNKLDTIGTTLYKLIKKYRIKQTQIIINKGEQENLIITKEVNNLIKKLNAQQYNIQINAYVLGENTNKTAFIHYVEESSGRIHFVNRHQMIAIDFIKQYPMTKFMDNRHIDYNTATLKEDINLSVYMIGFGNVNREILTSSIANNQYLVKTENGKLVQKLVKYYIYDSHEKLEDKNINHYYNRFTQESYDSSDDKYLPLDVRPAEVIFRPSTNINHADFYTKFRDDISKTNDNDLSYVIVSYGNEVDNIDLTEKIVAKLNEWNLKDQVKVFCRVGNSKFIDESAYLKNTTKYTPTNEHIEFDLFGNTITNTLYDISASTKYVYYPFGQEDKLVYNIECIFKNEVEKIAKERNFIYDLEYNKIKYNDTSITKTEDFLNLQKKAEEKWYKKLCQIQRDSNVYAFYNLKTKLHLLGFDYIEANETYDKSKYREATIEEFNAIYRKDSKIDIAFNINYQIKNKVITKPIYKSKPNEESIRWNMAVQEHYRWNAYHISSGVVPATIDFIITSPTNGKDFRGNRRHGNITTMEGLKTFGKIVAIKNYARNAIEKQIEKLNVSNDQKYYIIDEIMIKEITERFDFYKAQFNKLSIEEQNEYLDDSDVIKYDFQILDDLQWLFEVNNFTLLKKIND